MRLLSPWGFPSNHPDAADWDRMMYLYLQQPEIKHIKLITDFNLETLTRMTISGFHTHSHTLLHTLEQLWERSPQPSSSCYHEPRFGWKGCNTRAHMQLLCQADLSLQARHQRVPKRMIGELYTSLRPLLHISVHLESSGHWARLEVLLQPGILSMFSLPTLDHLKLTSSPTSLVCPLAAINVV